MAMVGSGGGRGGSSGGSGGGCDVVMVAAAAVVVVAAVPTQEVSTSGTYEQKTSYLRPCDTAVTVSSYSEEPHTPCINEPCTSRYSNHQAVNYPGATLESKP